jgi:hypothetical protein
MNLIAEYPEDVPSVANLREHWGKKASRAKRHRALAWAELRSAAGREQRNEFVLPIVVTITRIAPRKLDGDNLQSALKATRDGIADWLRIDDGKDGIAWNYKQERGRMGEKVVRSEVSQACSATQDAARSRLKSPSRAALSPVAVANAATQTSQQPRAWPNEPGAIGGRGLANTTARTATSGTSGRLTPNDQTPDQQQRKSTHDRFNASSRPPSAARRPALPLASLAVVGPRRQRACKQGPCVRRLPGQ